MYLFMITALLAFLIISVSLWLASFRHAPKFHADTADFTALLHLVLTGQADYEQWSAIIHLPIRHDPSLEALRLRCLEVEEEHYVGKPAILGHPEAMFTPAGLRQLEKELKSLEEEKPMIA